MNNLLIDVKTFRKRNGLKQKDLAKILGVSASYICQVEKGSCNMSQDMIERLIKTENQFNTNGLVPAYDRLLFALEEGKRTYGPQYNLPNFDTIENVKKGRIGISQEWAIIITNKIRTINPEWLINGTGTPLKSFSEIEHLLNQQEKAIYKHRDENIEMRIMEIHELLKIITAKVDTLTKLIKNHTE